MERLRLRADFLAAAAGARFPAPAFVLQVRRRTDPGPARVGFTVTRRIGTAVERNRARRRLKAMVRSAGPDGVRAGHDYVVVARADALTRPFDRLIADFRGTLRRAGGRGRESGESAGRTPGKGKSGATAGRRDRGAQ